MKKPLAILAIVSILFLIFRNNIISRLHETSANRGERAQSGNHVDSNDEPAPFGGNRFSELTWKTSRKNAENFLEASGRTPENLAAAYFLTTDDSYLGELKLQANDPTSIIVLSLFGGSYDYDDGEALEGLTKLNPENGAYKLLYASSRIGELNSEEVAELLRESANAESFDLQFEAIEASSRSLLRSTGISDSEACEIIADRNMIMFPAVISRINNQLVAKLLKSKLPQEESILVFESLMDIHEKINSPKVLPRYGIEPELKLNLLEQMILRTIPSQSQLIDHGMSASQRISLLAQDAQVLRNKKYGSP